MKKVILVLIALVGLYTILRSNIGIFPDGAMWITHHDIFHHLFLPLLMLISAVVSVVFADKPAYFSLAIGAMIVDSLNRLAIAMNHVFWYMKSLDLPRLEAGPGTVLVEVRLWPSHVMLLVELLSLAILYGSQRAKRSHNMSLK